MTTLLLLYDIVDMSFAGHNITFSAWPAYADHLALDVDSHFRWALRDALGFRAHDRPPRHRPLARKSATPALPQQAAD